MPGSTCLYTPQLQSITEVPPVLFSAPLRVGGSVGLGGWLHGGLQLCLPQNSYKFQYKPAHGLESLEVKTSKLFLCHPVPDPSRRHRRA